MRNHKTYSELIQFPTFKERFDYLKLNGAVGVDTFGWNRYLNQALYRSKEWKDFRNHIILRDEGCDLGIPDHEIFQRRWIIIHHINPIMPEDIENRDPMIFDPDNVICTILNTHNAIHYGDSSLLVTDPIIRTPNDTCPWKR